MSIYAIIVMAFINGNVIDADVLLGGEQQITEKNCPSLAHKALEMARPAATPDIQLVAKCVDIAQLPLTVSMFGSKAK